MHTDNNDHTPTRYHVLHDTPSGHVDWINHDYPADDDDYRPTDVYVIPCDQFHEHYVERPRYHQHDEHTIGFHNHDDGAVVWHVHDLERRAVDYSTTRNHPDLVNPPAEVDADSPSVVASGRGPGA